MDSQFRKIVKESSERGTAKRARTLNPLLLVLATMRKVGMDLILPASLHDKALACIYFSAQFLGKPVAHGELIDMQLVIKVRLLYRICPRSNN